MPYQVLVTGATGFLGSHLVCRLAEAGQRVRVLVRDPARLSVPAAVVDALDVRVGDITDPDSVADAVSGVGTVFHCAAFIGLGQPTDRRKLNRVNVGGTATVVNAALEAGIRRLVYTSSIAALGRSADITHCLDETAEWSESPLNTAYAISKYRAELEVHRAIAEGLDAVIVNPSVIMGPGRRGENTMKIAERVLAKTIPALPSGSTNVVDVEDVVEGLLAAMERGATGERYVLAGQNLSWTAIIGTLAEALGVEAPGRIMSFRLALFLGGLMELVSVVTRRPPLVSRESARLTGHKTCYDNAKAIRELDMDFRPFSETAARIAAVFDA
jgi:dihydroflavonol-4-reductase